jgi:hypothetical protein
MDVSLVGETRPSVLYMEFGFHDSPTWTNFLGCAELKLVWVPLLGPKNGPPSKPS